MKERNSNSDLILEKPLYFVWSNDDPYVLIALHPYYNKERQTLTWWDTTKERIADVESYKRSGDKSVTITTKRQTQLTFVPLSLQLYQNAVKDKLTDHPDFKTEEDMLAGFESTIN